MRYVRLKNGETEFLAVGNDRYKMDLYRKNTSGWEKSPKVSFPGCLKFMPYAEILEDGEKAPKAIEKTYGVTIEVVEEDACRSPMAPKALEPEAEFRVPERSPKARLGDYWQWSGSSLMDNTARGVLAEFLVATALGLTKEPRREWEGYDLRLPCGKTIEVKSSARVQSWPQKKCSPLQFGIAPRNTCWDSTRDEELRCASPRRWADIYVFCTLENCHIHEHRQALETDEWRFYVVCTGALDREFGEQKTATLGSLKKRLPERLKPCRYATLAQTIRDVARTTCSPCSPVEP